MKKQNLPVKVLLNDFESRLVREKLMRALNSVASQIRQRPGEEKEEKLTRTITQLTTLQQELQRANEDGLQELKRKLDMVLWET